MCLGDNPNIKLPNPAPMARVKNISYNKYLDCEIETNIRANLFQKCYYGLADVHWDRILMVSSIFSRYKIGPTILDVQNEGVDRRCIEYEKVIAFDNSRKPNPLANLSAEDIADMVTKTVKKMHKIGYGHGDLGLFNLGVSQDGKIKILDHDTVYELSSLNDLNRNEWLKYWIDDRWDGDIEYFEKSDYEVWRNDWLDV